MEIRVEWERVVQTKPYESLRIRLGLTETVLMPDEKHGSVIGPASVSVIARAAAEYERAFFESLAKLGDQLVVENLGRIQNPGTAAVGQAGRLASPHPPAPLADDPLYPTGAPARPVSSSSRRPRGTSAGTSEDAPF